MNNSTRNILLIGNTGQVGWELQRALAPLGNVTGVDYPQIDLIDPDSITGWLRQVKPGIIINAAAYTNVDKAETDLKNAHAINATAPGILAEHAAQVAARHEDRPRTSVSDQRRLLAEMRRCRCHDGQRPDPTEPFLAVKSIHAAPTRAQLTRRHQGVRAFDLVIGHWFFVTDHDGAKTS